MSSSNINYKNQERLKLSFKQGDGVVEAQLSTPDASLFPQRVHHLRDNGIIPNHILSDVNISLQQIAEEDLFYDTGRAVEDFIFGDEISGQNNPNNYKEENINENIRDKTEMLNAFDYYDFPHMFRQVFHSSDQFKLALANLEKQYSLEIIETFKKQRQQAPNNNSSIKNNRFNSLESVKNQQRQEFIKFVQEIYRNEIKHSYQKPKHPKSSSASSSSSFSSFTSLNHDHNKNNGSHPSSYLSWIWSYAINTYSSSSSSNNNSEWIDIDYNQAWTADRHPKFKPYLKYKVQVQPLLMYKETTKMYSDVQKPKKDEDETEESDDAFVVVSTQTEKTSNQKSILSSSSSSSSSSSNTSSSSQPKHSVFVTFSNCAAPISSIFDMWNLVHESNSNTALLKYEQNAILRKIHHSYMMNEDRMTGLVVCSYYDEHFNFTYSPQTRELLKVSLRCTDFFFSDIQEQLDEIENNIHHYQFDPQKGNFIITRHTNIGSHLVFHLLLPKEDRFISKSLEDGLKGICMQCSKLNVEAIYFCLPFHYSTDLEISNQIEFVLDATHQTLSENIIASPHEEHKSLKHIFILSPEETQETLTHLGHDALCKVFGTETIYKYKAKN